MPPKTWPKIFMNCLGNQSQNYVLMPAPFQVTDVTLARENQANFAEYLADNLHAHPGLDLTLTVLTTGFWPTYKTSDLNLPSEMVLGTLCIKITLRLVVWIMNFLYIG